MEVEGNGQQGRARLWQAGSYEHPATGRILNGKIHVLRGDDPSRTVCGRYTSTIGGWALTGTHGIDASTCQGCQHSIAARVRAEAEQAKWVAKQAQENEAWWRWYNAYLQTPAWNSRRMRVLARAGVLCEGCRIHNATQVHHLTYQRAGHEMLFDLVAICDACHDDIHRPVGTEEED